MKFPRGPEWPLSPPSESEFSLNSTPCGLLEMRMQHQAHTCEARVDLDGLSSVGMLVSALMWSRYIGLELAC